MGNGRASRSWLLVPAVLLSATAASSSTAPSEAFAGLNDSSRTVASFLSQSDLKSLSLAGKSMGHMLSFAKSLKPRGLFTLTGATEKFSFCTELDLRDAVVPNLLEVLTPQRFPNLVSLDLGSNTGEPVITHPRPVLASVNTLRVSQRFLHFGLLNEIFPNLQSLTVVHSWLEPVIDWSFLARLRSLKVFDAEFFSVGAPEAAALPQSLTVLRVAAVRAPFRLPHLQELAVYSDWMLPDLTTLEASSHTLKKLRIWSRQNLLDVQSLRLMVDSLEELGLGGFALTDDMLEQLEAISSLTNLRNLDFAPGSDSASTPLDASKVFGSRLLALENLSLERISAVNMQSFLNSVPMLNSLILAFSHLRDHPSLDVSHLGNLESLRFWFTQLTDLRLWNDTLNTGATRLLILNASRTQACHGMQHLKLLRSARVDGTAVVPEHIAKLINLRHLTCHGIADVGPLSSLVHLEELNIEEGPTPDLSPLARIQQLRVSTELFQGPIADFLARFPATSSR